MVRIIANAVFGAMTPLAHLTIASPRRFLPLGEAEHGGCAMPTELPRHPPGPRGISWELAEQIRATIRRDGSASIAQIAADAGVAPEIVGRIARNMRKRAKRDERAR